MQTQTPSDIFTTYFTNRKVTIVDPGSVSIFEHMKTS